MMEEVIKRIVESLNDEKVSYRMFKQVDANIYLGHEPIATITNATNDKDLFYYYVVTNEFIGEKVVMLNYQVFDYETLEVVINKLYNDTKGNGNSGN